MTPNTRKPTVEEVGDKEKCWYWHFAWYSSDGASVRDDWWKDSAWLPYSAIPDPNSTQQGEPK